MADSNSFLSPFEIIPIAQEYKYLGIWGKIFSFYHEIVCYLYSLEAPQRGDSNEYKQHTILYRRSKIPSKIIPIYFLTSRHD